MIENYILLLFYWFSFSCIGIRGIDIHCTLALD